jgi:hypothetical protein
MTRDRAGGLALIISAVGFTITMALHPTGRELLAPGQLVAVTRMVVGVHALALACLPIAFFGALILSQRLDALGALVTYGFGIVAVMNAAVCSGLVAPRVAGQSPELFAYTGYLNQAFALVYVMASCVAIVLWSIAMLKRARAIGIAGLVLGPLIIIALLSHLVGLDVHGFGAIMFTESAWFVVCGVWLLRISA